MSPMQETRPSSHARAQVRRTAIAVAALVAIAAPWIAHARPGAECGGDARGAWMLESLERNLPTLGLDAKQLDAAYQVIDQARQQRRALAPQLRDAHQHLRQLLDADAPDADAVTAQADAIGALETKLHEMELRAVLQVRGMLTADQRSQLDRQRAQHMTARPSDT